MNSYNDMTNFNKFKNYCYENFLTLKENFKTTDHLDSVNKTVGSTNNFKNENDIKSNTSRNFNEKLKEKSNSYSRKNSPLKYLESSNKFDICPKGNATSRKINNVNDSVKANLNKKLMFLSNNSSLNQDIKEEIDSTKLLGQKIQNRYFVQDNSKDLDEESNYYNIKLLLYSNSENNSNDDSLIYYLPFSKNPISDEFSNCHQTNNELNYNLNRKEDSYLTVNELSLNYTLLNRFKSIKEKEKTNLVDNQNINEFSSVSNLSNVINVSKPIKSILKVKTQQESLNLQIQSDKTKSIDWESNIAKEKIFLFTDEPNAKEITQQEYEFIQNSLKEKIFDQ